MMAHQRPHEMNFGHFMPIPHTMTLFNWRSTTTKLPSRFKSTSIFDLVIQVGIWRPECI